MGLVDYEKKMNTGDKQKTAQEVSGVISRHVQDFENLQARGNTQGMQKQSWTAPESGGVKINMDAAFLAESEVGAWGFVIRDELGNFLAGAAGKLQYVRSPLQAEISACMKAIEGAADLGAQRIILESDCLMMNSALKSRDYDTTELGVLFREARSVCHASFGSYEFMFCHRECNRVAHSVAQFGLRAAGPFSVWAAEAPDFVSVLVDTEMVRHL